MKLNGDWDWQPPRSEGLWKYGPLWLKPFTVAAPWLTVALLLVMMYFLHGHYIARDKGLLFDLPDAGFADGEITGLVAVMFPNESKTGGRDTAVCFDDSLYSFEEANQMGEFGRALGQAAAREPSHTLLLLADRRISAGDLMKFVAFARLNGVEKVLVANRDPASAE